MISINIGLALLFISLILLLHNIINCNKSRRSRQFLLIFWDMIASAMIIFVIMENLPEIQLVLQQLANFSDIFSFLKNCDILAINLMAMLGLVLSKLAMCPVISKLCNNQRFISLTASKFYFFDDECHNEWFLKHRWVQYRRLVFCMVIGLTIATSVFLGLTWFLGNTSKIWFITFPCMAIIVLNEFYCFINGYTKEEFESNSLAKTQTPEE